MSNHRQEICPPGHPGARQGRAEVAGGPNVAQANGCALGDPRAASNPLLLLPKGAATEAIVALWMANAHLFPTSLALATTVRLYLDQGAIDQADVGEIVRRLLSPERRAGHRFASDLMADLSAMVADIARHRKTARDREERKRLEAMPHAQQVEAIYRQIGQPDEAGFVD